MSDPVDLYARRLERAITEAQAILAAATHSWGIPAADAVHQLVAVLDHDDLLGVMVHNGARERYPETISLQVPPCRANA